MTRSGDRSVAMAVVLLVAVAGLLTTSDAAFGKKKAKKFEEQYRLTAMGTGHSGLAAGRASALDLTVKRWTTAEERQAILEVLATNDGKKILRFLEDLPEVGFIRIPGRQGVELSYAYEFEEGGKRTVVLATERSLASMPTLMDPGLEYLVAVIVLRLDEDGTGDGNILPALELEMKGDRLEVVSSAADPITLTKVVRR